ncbi:hypothetical protein AK812_SmicGene46779, partial [Symbiodinium microadriaticum]
MTSGVLIRTPDRAALLLVGKTRDLVDYLLARRDEPCGRSVPETILKAISWVKKDKITEILSEEVWGSLRWSDLQAIISAELALVRAAWSRELLPHAGYKRDYLMLRLNADGGLEQKPAGYGDALVATAGLSLMQVSPQDKALFAEAARRADRCTRLDEREIAADLVPWLMERLRLSRDQAELTVEGLRRRWKGGGCWDPDPFPATPTSEEPPLGEPTGPANPEDSSLASASEPEEPVCKQASEDDPSEGSLANSGDEQAPPEAVLCLSLIPVYSADEHICRISQIRA